MIPELPEGFQRIDYPRPITSVHQIELSSRCNLRCQYCPSRHLDKPKDEGGYGREKQDITREHFERALVWAKHFAEQGTQGELALTGIGEALLHPEFVDFLRLAREALPNELITFSTNGILLTEDLVERIKPYGPGVYISLHRPEKAKPAIDLARRAGLLSGINAAFATEAFDWAGGLDWDVTIPENTMMCEYLGLGRCVVLADGRITTCCLDATGSGVVGHVDDEPGSLRLAPWEGDGPNGRKVGCSECHMKVPIGEQVL